MCFSKLDNSIITLYDIFNFLKKFGYSWKWCSTIYRQIQSLPQEDPASNALEHTYLHFYKLNFDSKRLFILDIFVACLFFGFIPAINMTQIFIEVTQFLILLTNYTTNAHFFNIENIIVDNKFYIQKIFLINEEILISQL